MHTEIKTKKITKMIALKVIPTAAPVCKPLESCGVSTERNVTISIVPTIYTVKYIYNTELIGDKTLRNILDPRDRL